MTRQRARRLVAATIVVSLVGSPIACTPAAVTEEPAAPTVAADSAYRLGYTSTDRPVLMTIGEGRYEVVREEVERAQSDADVRGSDLVFAAGTGDIVLAALDAILLPRIRQLTEGPDIDRQPALSPDGRLVAFASNRGGSLDIWLIGADGSGLRRLTDHPGEDSWPAWSPDGTQIAFSATRDDPAGDIYVMSVDGTSTTRLTDDPAADTEPAWSPDGKQIAFTTTRFAAAGDVVTMPATGGAVQRAVPAPWDSAQAAWGPDGLLAVTTRRNDPAGDVIEVSGGRVNAVAERKGVVEEHPTWHGDQVVFTDQDDTDSTDIWTAAPDGSDRRDLTNRPRFDEDGPAFSRDGTKLAYSADFGEGGVRIMVADADGDNPVAIAPPGTEPSDVDTDPTWSPDATMLAFVRRRPGGEGSPGFRKVLVARVADGRLVGELPMPDALSGEDHEPAWSPDGTRIAVSREVERRDTNVSLPHVDQTLAPGGVFTIEQTVATPFIPPMPDIVFLIDNSASMQDIFLKLKPDVFALIDDIRREQPEARFAVASFEGSGSPRMHNMRLQLNDNATTVADTIGDIAGDGIGSASENWVYSLLRIATDDGPEGPDFRDGSSRIVVLISDTYSHDRNTPSGDLIETEQLITAFNAAGVAFIAVPMLSNPADPVPEDPMSADPFDVAPQLAAATGGRVAEGSRPDQIMPAIRTAIRSLKLSVRPVVESCDSALTVTFNPAEARVPAGTPATFTETVRLAPGAVPGSVLTCTLRFDIAGTGINPASRQKIVVTVGAQGAPFVRVDDVVVQAAGPDGARVQYTATAVDVSGRELPVTCTPPSGSLFPVGQTIVTCTAVGVGGRTGRDVAAITVLSSSLDFTRHVWLARLSVRPDGLVDFTDQHDLSVRIGDGCPAGNLDSAPAWSPDGAFLALITAPDVPDDRPSAAASRARLCVARPDGSDARDALSGDDPPGAVEIYDPAWSPDGAEIAFAAAVDVNPYDLRIQIHTVPVSGGPTRLRIANDGDATEPAYQRLASSDLTVSVQLSLQPGYVGGDDITATFTAVNGSARPATNAWLSLTLPAQLQPAITDPRCVAMLCRIGTLGMGDTVTITVVLKPVQALATAVHGRLTATVGQQEPTSREASLALAVKQPTIVADPPLGKPGFVTQARGLDFPPGATVRIFWAPGLTTTPDTIVVNPDGTFAHQQLVLPKDALGARRLGAVHVSGGARFGPVDTPFLVVARPLQPPDFVGR